MPGRSIAIALGGVVIGAVIAGGTVAIAQSDGSSVTGPEADRATAAAIEAAGGGRATAIERDGGTWEIEVTKPDGSTVDVDLDANNTVLQVDPDNETDDGDNDATETPEADAAEDEAEGTVGDDAIEDAAGADDAPESPEADAAEDQAEGTVGDDAIEDAGETDDD